MLCMNVVSWCRYRSRCSIHMHRGVTYGIERLILLCSLIPAEFRVLGDVLRRGSLRGYLNGISDEIIGDRASIAKDRALDM